MMVLCLTAIYLHYCQLRNNISKIRTAARDAAVSAVKNSYSLQLSNPAAKVDAKALLERSKFIHPSSEMSFLLVL